MIRPWTSTWLALFDAPPPVMRAPVMRATDWSLPPCCIRLTTPTSDSIAPRCLHFRSSVRSATHFDSLQNFVRSTSLPFHSHQPGQQRPTRSFPPSRAGLASPRPLPARLSFASRCTSPKLHRPRASSARGAPRRLSTCATHRGAGGNWGEGSPVSVRCGGPRNTSEARPEAVWPQCGLRFWTNAYIPGPSNRSDIFRSGSPGPSVDRVSTSTRSTCQVSEMAAEMETIKVSGQVVTWQ